MEDVAANIRLTSAILEKVFFEDYWGLVRVHPLASGRIIPATLFCSAFLFPSFFFSL